MRYRFTFAAGLAAGYILGTRAGRERYEQIKRLGQRAAGSPAVQKAAGTVSAKATELGNAAKDKATGKLPKFTEMAMSKASAIPGLRGRVNGSADYPASDPPEPDVYNPPPSPGTSRYPDGS